MKQTWLELLTPLYPYVDEHVAMMCIYPCGLFGIPYRDAEYRDGALGYPACVSGYSYVGGGVWVLDMPFEPFRS